MSLVPFLESTFAAARKHLENARKHQHYALGYASCQYMHGYQGRTAKRLYREHDAKRAKCIELALLCRAQAKRLRAELAKFMAADTVRVSA